MHGKRPIEVIDIGLNILRQIYTSIDLCDSIFTTSTHAAANADTLHLWVGRHRRVVNRQFLVEIIATPVSRLILDGHGRGYIGCADDVNNARHSTLLIPD